MGEPTALDLKASTEPDPTPVQVVAGALVDSGRGQPGAEAFPSSFDAVLVVIDDRDRIELVSWWPRG
jgi:hypothetical protein